MIRCLLSIVLLGFPGMVSAQETAPETAMQRSVE